MPTAKLGGKALSSLRVARIVAIAVIAAASCGYLDTYTHTFDLVEQKAYGWRLEAAARVGSRRAERLQKQIVLVTISDTSFDSSAHGLPPGQFLPRQDHARVIQELTRDGAKVIGFDLLFDTPQPGDSELAAAIHSSNRVLLACGDKGQEQPEIIWPEPQLLQAGARRGHTRVPQDLDRPAIDRLEPVVMDQGQPVTAFSVEAARLALGMAALPPCRTVHGWRIPGLTVPTDNDGTFKIRYFGPPGTFMPHPYEDILNGSASEKNFFRENHLFENKIVLIGDTTRVHQDYHLTPLGDMAGVEIQANAIATLLAGGSFIREAPGWANGLLLVGLAALAALFASVWRLQRAARFLALLLPVYLLLNFILFVKWDIFLHLVAPSATIIVSALGLLLERGLTEEEEKTRIYGLLQRYVNPKIASYIVQHPELLTGTGKRVSGTVLFSDICDFTALSEQLPPEELIRRMTEYFETMTDVVFRHDGTAASIVGDGMMALFGIPVPQPDHARCAVAAAIEMQSALARLQERWQAQGQKSFEMGIGINTGEMIVGSVGGQQLMNFTVYGLQVNIASRVQGLTRKLKAGILITRATYRSVSEAVEVCGPFPIPVKGVDGDVEVFDVQGWQEGMNAG